MTACNATAPSSWKVGGGRISTDVVAASSARRPVTVAARSSAPAGVGLLALLLLLLVSPAAAQDAAADMPPSEMAWRIALCCILVLGSGYCSGLTLAVMGLDPLTLEITKSAGTPQERAWAAAILPVRKRGNLLLCSLLWSNMAINAGLSIVMAELTSGEGDESGSGDCGHEGSSGDCGRLV